MSSQTVSVEIDAGEMIDRRGWSTTRKLIDEHGAKGIGDGFGLISLTVNGKTVLHMQMREDRVGHVVIVLTDALTNEQIGTIDPELYGLISPRRRA